jgi:hypothetical protein
VKRFQQLITQHRAAAVIVAIVVAGFAAWELHLATMGGPGATSGLAPAAAPTPAASASRTHGPAVSSSAGARPSGDAALRAASQMTGTASPAPATSAGATALASDVPPGTGRSDPFSPLATPGGGRGGANPSLSALPPVPPLSPNGLAPSASTPGGATSSPLGKLELTGIVYGPSALAILNDGTGSYVVEPGDTVTPGVRIVAIDPGNRTVTLTSHDQSWQLRLGGGTSR